MFINVLKLSKEKGEHSLVLCLSKDEKTCTFLNGTLNIKYEKNNSNRNAACLCLASHPQRTIGSLAAFYLHSPKSVDFRGKGKAR